MVRNRLLGGLPGVPLLRGEERSEETGEGVVTLIDVDERELCGECGQSAYWGPGDFDSMDELNAWVDYLLQRAHRAADAHMGADAAAYVAHRLWLEFKDVYGTGAINRTPLTDEIRQVVMERDEFTCGHCGATVGLQIDHIVPRSKGGPNVECNLQVLCGTCNSRKGAR